MGEGLSECRIAHGDEGEGVILIRLLSFLRRIWAEVGGAGGSVWRWRHRSMVHCCCFVAELFGLLFWFRRSEFEIGICIEIGILPEHSEANNFFKINSWDSRSSDDQ